MSRRNTLAAKRTRRQGRPAQRPAIPSAATRELAARMIHESVCITSASDGFGACMLYAGIGAAVATRLTGRPYLVQAGGLSVGTGADPDHPDGELQYAWIGDSGEHQAGHHDFHAWIGTAAGPVFADFSLRHTERGVRLAGASWEREPLPAYYWGDAQAARNLRLHYRPDAETTLRIRAMLRRPKFRTIDELASCIAQDIGAPRRADR